MNAWTEDPGVYESLQPFYVAAYLRAHGWRKTGDIRDVASVWAPPPEEQRRAEIVLPADTTVGDFAVRSAELVRTLTVLEGRPAGEIIADITTVTSDVVRLSFLGQAYDAGSMPIETGAQLVGFARDAVVAAASVTVAPRSVLTGRRPGEVTEFIRKVRLGQTERGSYVLTLQTPVRPEFQLELDMPPGSDVDPLDDPRVPYERRVMLRFARAVAAAREAAVEAVATGSIGGFTEAVQEGVSANLCDALAGMLDAAETQALNVRVTWSPARRERTQVPSFISFDKAAAEVLSVASRAFRERAAPRQLELDGTVSELRRPAGLKGGTIVLDAIIDGHPRSVEVELDAPEYLDAIEAHKGEVRVRCRGDLVKGGRRYELRNPTDFEIEPSYDVSFARPFV